jgi:uncharacterized membrane protein YphA (DoxX/SURF4 family)
LQDFLSRWFPVVLRAVVVLALAPSAFSKFLQYGASVDMFEGWGIPAPSLMVVVVGFFEVAAVFALILGLLGRLASVPMLVIMPVAMITASVNPLNVLVFLGCLGIALLGTGALSLWRPEDRVVPPLSTTGAP